MGPSSFTVTGSSIEVRVEYTSSFICAGAISNPIFNQTVQNLSPATYSVDAAAYLDGVFVNSVSVGSLTVTPCIATGIESNKLQQSLAIYPNPASQFITIDNYTNNQQAFQLFDISGRFALTGLAIAK